MFIQEFYKMFTRSYAFIALLVIFVLMLLFGLSFAVEGGSYYNSFVSTFGKGVEFNGKLVNGNMFAYQLLHALWLFVPLLIVFVTGGMISEEKSEGVLRMILARPVSKTKFFTDRFMAAILYVFIVVVLMAVLSVGIGLLVFGNGELLVFDKGNFTVLSPNAALIRFGVAYAYYAVILFTVASLSMLFSVIYQNSLKAVMVTVSVILSLYFITSLDIAMFDGLKPFLFTSYFSTWSRFFAVNIHWMNFAFDIIVLSIHILVFYVLAVVLFNKKEIYN